MNKQIQFFFYQHKNKWLSEIPRIAYELKKKKQQVIEIIAKKTEENNDH